MFLLLLGALLVCFSIKQWLDKVEHDMVLNSKSFIFFKQYAKEDSSL